MMKQLFLSASILITVSLLFGQSDDGNSSSRFEHFISVDNDRLMEGDAPFRFISFNVPNLHVIEDNLPFDQPNPWRWPDEFEIRDALKTIVQMGGQVARIYTLTVRRPDDGADVPRHIQGPGEFNERAFEHLDQILAIANELGIRLIIPLVDNWSWMGGRAEYCSFRNKDASVFYTDTEIIDDFKTTIDFVLNRKNTITGVQYKNDKAILAWELGNELKDCPTRWTTEMARYMKTIDKNHLINDGLQSSRIQDRSLSNPYVDLVSTHHYETNPVDMLNHILSGIKTSRGKKPYYVGEFGFISTTGMQSILNAIIKHPGIAGGLVWSLRFHNRDGGFYWHSEPLGRGIYKAYHWPGFHSGHGYDESDVCNLMKEKAFEIRNQSSPPVNIPSPPTLLSIDHVSRISWRGSVGAESYILERSFDITGPWTRIASNLSDAHVAYAPLTQDPTAKTGWSYYYRLRAQNAAGLSEPSNVVGPVQVTTQSLVDELCNWGTICNSNNKVTLVQGNDRAFKEDFHRLAGQPDGSILYCVPEPIKGFRIHCFTQSSEPPLYLSVSADGYNFQQISGEMDSFFRGKQDYDYWKPVLIYSEEQQTDSRYLKLNFFEDAQVGRIEIFY